MYISDCGHTFSGLGSWIVDTDAFHTPLVVATRGAGIGALFGRRVAELLVRYPALHCVTQSLLQDPAL